MMKLGPGCVCQPVVPPGCHVFCWTYRSESPFVWIFSDQDAGTVWTCEEISP